MNENVSGGQLLTAVTQNLFCSVPYYYEGSLNLKLDFGPPMRYEKMINDFVVDILWTKDIWYVK